MKLPKIKSSPKISEMVISTIFKSIEDGDIKVGEELPSERELSEAFNISRGALREGLSILEFLGIIVSEGKRKTISKGANAIKKALQIVRLSNNDDVIYDFIEIRRVLEDFIVKLACERATDKDIGKISKAVQRLEKNIDDVDADYMFHISLAQSSHNVFLAAIEELIVTMLASVRQKSTSSPGRKEIIPGEHRAILEAVIARDVDLVRSRMAEHLNNMEKNIKKINEDNKEDSK